MVQLGLSKPTLDKSAQVNKMDSMLQPREFDSVQANKLELHNYSLDRSTVKGGGVGEEVWHTDGEHHWEIHIAQQILTEWKNHL